ncbi:flagellar protein FliT [Heyndrickxia sp. NPDC080065]|uniref:flagellar protein FliT n=1 Tax=Heyndrickxia sp. NPDC080065 TaxID=3390568 RepID=UPI003CFBE239
MTPIQECFKLTEEMIEVLQATNEEERDVTIEKVENFLERREKLLEYIKPPFSEEEQLLGDRLVLLGKQLDVLLMNLKQEIQKDMNGLNQKKKSLNQYANPYSNLQNDGYFYDKRK